MQKKIIEKCDCYDLRYPKLTSSSAPCLNKEKILCAESAYAQFKNNSIDSSCLSSCPLECESIQYDLSISSSNYPSIYQYDVYQSTLGGMTYDELKERSIALNIFYSNLNYLQISESPKTSLNDLMSNVGGTLGLYIGISFLSLIEIVEIVCEIFLTLFNLSI